jgi:hypothetical protein
LDALLLKPFSLNELRDAVEQVLSPAPPDQISELPALADPPPAPKFIPPPKL